MTPNTGSPGAQSESSDAFASDLLRGHTDTIVLGVLRDADRYGFEIYKTIRDANTVEDAFKLANLRSAE